MDKQIVDVIVVGAGLSGLSVAHFLEKMDPEKQVLILEKAHRPGGAIQSLKEDGFLAEWGPHGFLDNVAETRELMEDLDFGDAVQKASLKQFLRYICLDGKLKEIPQSPPRIIKSDLLSMPAKLRVLGDLWKKPRKEEQTVADWVTYRFGKASLPFADIAMTGTYGGRADKLSVDSVWPGLRRLELEYGSVFRGAIKHRRTQKAMNPSSDGTPRRSGLPSMVSFRDGMEQLVQKLSENRTIRYDTAVSRFDLTEDGWQVEAENEHFFGKNLVLALQINQSLSLLKAIDPPPKQSVSEAFVYNVVMGFPEDVEIPFGFGYLAPASEKRFALGSLFPTHMFPGRAPDKMNTLEVLVGGLRNPERLVLSDEELTGAALADVSQLIKLPSQPLFTKVLRPTAAIPQLEMGHHKLQVYRTKMEQKMAGLFICGFGWEGIGTNDMIKMARRTAENLLSPDAARDSQADVKGVYF